MHARAERFRESVREENRGRSRRRRRFTEAQRGEALEYLDERRSEGAAVASIAGELGISKSSLERWRSRRSSFVRVATASAAAESVSIITPAGYRIEGLSLDQAAELLRRLG